MDNRITTSSPAASNKPTLMRRLGDWIQDPMGGVIAASAATIGSFGVVLSGMWFIGLAVN